MQVRNPAIGLITSEGTFVGDNTANRAIPHSLGKTPQIVVLSETTGITTGHIFVIIRGRAYIFCAGSLAAGGESGFHAITIPDNINFHVGNVANYHTSANFGTRAYYWVAFG